MATEETEREPMMNEEEKVLAAYEEMQQAMIGKDIDALDRIVKDGTLNYYRYKIENCKIAVSGNTTTLSADVTLTAKVYGTSGSWTLPVNARFERINEEWIYFN